MEEKIEVRREIDLSKRYDLPSMVVRAFKGAYVVVAPETANWLVFRDKRSLDFLYLLEDYPLGKALERFEEDIEFAREVVMQLEAKDFENKEAKEPSKALTMHLHLTNRCNLQCPHCYMDSGDSLEDEFSTEELLSLLKSFASFGGEKLILTGGEIALRRDLEEIVRLAHSSGMRVQLLTNGTLWTPSKILQIAPYIQEVQISVDGYNEEENSKVRGKGNFYKALKALELFLEQGVFGEVAITPAQDGTLGDKVDEYVDFVKSLFERFGDERFNLKISGDILDGRDLKFAEQERKERLKAVEQIYLKVFETTQDEPFAEFHRQRKKEGNCIYGNLNVTADGKVYACPVLGKMTPFADLRQDTFEEVMRRSEMARKISHVDSIEPCSSCELRYICGGDCRIEYFPSLLEGDTVCSKDCKAPRRICTKAYKDSMYDLMVRTNELCFR